MTEKKDTNHKILIEDRNRMIITGVKKVKSFDPKEIHLDTLEGGLVIKGQDLGVKNLNLEQSELEIEGRMDLLAYATNRSPEASRGMWERIFK